ncbi:hypothetical protein CR513_43085, partial [Mucuna pruriens]
MMINFGRKSIASCSLVFSNHHHHYYYYHAIALCFNSSYVFWSPCKTKPVCISCLARTLREPLGLLIKEVSPRSLLTPVGGLSFRLQGNPEEKTSICVLLKTFALVILSSMTLSTEENNFVAQICNVHCVCVFQCKHQLAARLAASLGSYVEVKVSDEELAVLLSKI